MHGHGLHNPKKAGLSGLFLYAALAIALLAATGRATAAPLAIEVAGAETVYDSRTQEPIISIKMTAVSGAAFAELTRNNIGHKLEIRVDGKAMSAPVIREPILGGTAQIAGSFTLKEARDFAKRLNAGTAKLEVEIVD
jgi:preprotein translocase subunit SecD